ncbi:MAG: Rpn family recombination-promoting nuclease/putative transposase [Planctomycetota bacterium]|jgi:predicted transposase YdaD|nr:Rpn family recombination-promoting nuclease/putative transposase [Planctomycetota bacterium]
MDIFPLAQPHDHLARHFLTNPDLAADLLRNYVDREVVEKFDLDRLQVESPVNVSAALAERLGDIRLSTGFKGSARKSQVFILMEHQSTPDRLIALRVIEYIILDFRARLKRKASRKGDSKIFPYPLAVILYHGKRPWREPLRIWEMIHRVPGLPGGLLDVPIYLVDLASLPAGEIKGKPALRALLSALRAASNRGLEASMEDILRMVAEARDDLRFPDWVQALSLYYLSLETPREGLKAMTRKLERIMPAKEAKNMTTSLAEKLVLQGEEKGLEKGLEKGRKEGEEKGRKEGIILVLKTRFNSVPKKIRERVSACSDSGQLEAWIRLAAGCLSLEEFGQSLE